MRPNKFKDLLKSGGKGINGWLSIPSAVTAEIMSQRNFDSVTIDMQHGLIDYSDVLPMLQAISTTNKTPMVRVPWLENGIIMKCLDAGAYGIICPMVNTAQDAEDFVQACSYAPRGRRSFGPMRALMYAGADYQPNANDTVLKIAMIETVEAMENMEAIMATPNLDGIYIGPSDLSLSMGFPPKLDTEVPEVLEAIANVIACAKRHGLVIGIHTSAGTYAGRMLDEGMDFVSIGSEARMMVDATDDYISTVRKTAPAQKVAGY
ncbi:MAG: HpcH/HpaI aldolase family protein [Alphaproteobacteria bacterium]